MSTFIEDCKKEFREKYCIKNIVGQLLPNQLLTPKTYEDFFESKLNELGKEILNKLQQKLVFHPQCSLHSNPNLMCRVCSENLLTYHLVKNIIEALLSERNNKKTDIDLITTAICPHCHKDCYLTIKNHCSRCNKII